MYDEHEARSKREAKRRLRRKTSAKTSPGKALCIIVSCLLIGGCLLSIISDMIELDEKQSELAELQLKAEALEIQNASYSSILSEKDERTYMERMAIEKGYAYPEERRFYDTTRN